jgi:hypothetical protein
MSFPRSPLPDLTPRGTAMVSLTVRFGLVVPDTYGQLFSDSSHDAGRKFLDRLVEDGWMAKHHFPAGPAYYVLSDPACHRLRLKRSGKALRQAPLLRRSLVLMYFAAHRILRLLTPSECREHLPTLYRRGAACPYFLNSESSSLGCLCVDDMKSPRRVHTNVLDLAAKQRLSTELRQLMSEHRFGVLVLTTTTDKEKQLVDLLARRPPREKPVEVVAVPRAAQLCGLAPRSQTNG